MEWQSDSRFSVLEQPRTEVQNAGVRLVNLGAMEGYRFCLLGSRFDATRGADNAARSRAALVFYFSSPPPGKRPVNMPGCES